MSGGAFDYAFSRVNEFNENLAGRISLRGEKNQWGEATNFFDEPTMVKLREIVTASVKHAALMREVEWLYSGDTSEESFLERVKEIEAK